MPAATQAKTLVRDSQGRFAKGNGGGPGNPFAKQVARLKAIFLECLSVEKMKALVNTLIDAAIEGNVTAARLVLQYSLGKPTASADVSNPAPASSPTGRSSGLGIAGPGGSTPAAASNSAGSVPSPATPCPTPTPVAPAARQRSRPSPRIEKSRVSHPSGAVKNARVSPTRPPLANGFSASGGTGDFFDNLLSAKEICDRAHADPSLDRLIPEISDEMLERAAAPRRPEQR